MELYRHHVLPSKSAINIRTIFLPFIRLELLSYSLGRRFRIQVWRYEVELSVARVG